MRYIKRFLPLFILILCIASQQSYAADVSPLEIRLVHPENEKLVNNVNHKNVLNLEGYEQVLNRPNGWPEILWVKRKVEIDIKDLEGASIELTKPVFTEEEVNFAKKQNPSVKIPADLEQALIHGGQPQIKLRFNAEGTKKLASLTTQHVGGRIAIFLDGKLLSAPKILDPITDGVAIIMYSMSYEENEAAVDRIRSLISKMHEKQ